MSAAPATFPVRFRLVGVTFTLSMLLYIDRVAISAAKGPVTSAFGLNDVQFGWVLSAFALGYALGQLPAGMLADRWGPRIMLAAVVVLWSLFTGLTGVAGGLGSLLLARFLFGLGEAGAYPTVSRAFFAWLPAGERGLAQGINNSGARIGAAAALPVIAWIVASAGWRETFFVLGAFGLAWALAWYVWFRDLPETHRAVSAEEIQVILERRGGAAAPAARPLRVRDLATARNMWLTMGQYFALNFTFFFCLTWLFPYLQRTYNLPALKTGFLAAAPLVGGAIGNWVGGGVGDALFRSGRPVLARRLPAMIGFALSSSGLLASLAFHDPVSVVLCLMVAIFGADMAVPVSWALCIDIGRHNTGAVGGTMNMAGNLGAFVTSLAFPYLVAFTGSTVPFFVLGAGLNLAAIAAWLGIDPLRPITPESAGPGRLPSGEPLPAEGRR